MLMKLIAIANSGGLLSLWAPFFLAGYTTWYRYVKIALAHVLTPLHFKSLLPLSYPALNGIFLLHLIIFDELNSFLGLLLHNFDGLPVLFSLWIKVYLGSIGLMKLIDLSFLPLLVLHQPKLHAFVVRHILLFLQLLLLLLLVLFTLLVGGRALVLHQVEDLGTH